MEEEGKGRTNVWMKSRWWWNLCERLLDFVPSGRWLPFCRCFFFFYFKNITYRMVFLFLIFFVFVSASNHHNPLSSNRRLGSSGFLLIRYPTFGRRKPEEKKEEDDGVWRRHGCWYFFEGHRENLYYDQQEVLPEQPCDAFIHLGLRPIIFLGFFFFFHLRWSILCDL